MDQTSANVTALSLQALNLYFRSGLRHFASSDVRFQMHKVYITY